MIRYLIDTNVFDEAYLRIYRPAQFTGVWDWYAIVAEAGLIGSVPSVSVEIGDKSALSKFLRPILPPDFFKELTKQSLKEHARIQDWLRSHDAYSEAAVDKFVRGADLDLIAMGLAEGISVVTLEEKEPPDKKNKAVKIPDVCDEFGVEVVRPHKMFSDEGVKFVLHREFGISARLG